MGKKTSLPVTIRLIARASFYILGTFLHELAHYCAAALFGKPARFSLVPRIEGGMMTFGSTSVRVRYRMLMVFIAAAPLVWWGVLYYLLVGHTQLVLLAKRTAAGDSTLLLNKVKALSLGDLFFSWVLVQLFWAGKLSLTDMKELLRGALSLSGLVAVASIALILWVTFYIL
jgi:hypothetical protein